MDFDRRRRNVQEINLTALIDIVFHLMIFVMLSTSFVVSESMELSLPSSKSASASSNAAADRALRILIAANGELSVDDKTMDKESLSATLLSRLTTNPDEKIAIFTTPGVSVQQLVGVMDTVYLTGGRNVQVDKVR